MYIWASFAVPNLKMPSDQVAISTQSPPSSGSLWNLEPWGNLVRRNQSVNPGELLATCGDLSQRNFYEPRHVRHVNVSCS